MTSISALSSNSYQQSPLQRLQDELQSEVDSGATSSFDQSALSTALTDIDSSLQAGRSSDQSGGTRSSPGDLKSKIDDLIQNEVSSGKLTSDQATELQGVFKSAFANGPAGGGGPGGAGGPPPGDGSSSTDATGDSSSTSSSSTDDVLKEFLKLLQDSLSSSTSYNAAGTSFASSNSTSISALLIDYQS